MSFIKTGSYPEFLGFHGNRREEVDWRGKRALENVDEKPQFQSQSNSSRGENVNMNTNVNSNVKSPNYNDYIYKCDICHGLLRREFIYEHAEKHRIALNRQAQFQFQNHQIPKETEEEEEQQQQQQQEQKQEVETPLEKPAMSQTEPWSQNSSIPNFNYNRWANSGYNYNYMSRLPPQIPNQIQFQTQAQIPVPVPTQIDYSSDPRIQRHYPVPLPQSFVQEKPYPGGRDRLMSEKRPEMHSYSADQLIVISHWNRMNQLHQNHINNNNNNSQPLELPVNLNVTDSRQQLRQFLQANKRRAGVIQMHRSQSNSKDLTRTATATSTGNITTTGAGTGTRTEPPQSKRAKLSHENKEGAGQKQENSHQSVIKMTSKFKENGKLESKSMSKPKPKMESRKFKQDDESTPNSNSNSDSDSDSEYSVSSLLAQNCLPPLPELDDFKPFSCHLCSDEFYSKLGINTHLAVHHRIKF